MSYFLAKSLSLSLGLSFISLAATAQSNPTPVPMPNAIPPSQRIQKTLDSAPIYRHVGKMPVYLNGGKDGLQTFISRHVREPDYNYGSEAYVTFIIDRTGKVRNPAFGPDAAYSEGLVASE